MKKKTLKVHPNRYAALDADGNPAGAVQQEGMANDFVGARLVREGTDPELKLMLSGAGAPAERMAPARTFEFDDDGKPLELPITPYYLAFLRTRELLPADAFTAGEAGVPFVPVAEALAAAQETAALRFLGENGETPEWFDDAAYKARQAERKTAAERAAKEAEAAKAKADAEVARTSSAPKSALDSAKKES